MEKEFYSSDDNKKIAKKSRKGILNELLNTSLYLLLVLLLTFLLVRYVGQRTEVIGTSMVPTLQDADQLIADKISYRFIDPKRFDIIIFPYQYEEDTHFIKRIIGLPGETVHINEAGTIFINGEVLAESYGKETILNPGLASSDIVLGADEYFVLGDNRNDSKDSRSPDVGNIKRSEITGRAWIRIWPFSEFGVLKHQ